MTTKRNSRKHFLGAVFLGVLLWAAALPQAMAEDETPAEGTSVGADVQAEGEVEPEKEPAKHPYRGTAFSYTNTVQTRSFDPGRQQTPNAYYGMSWGLTPTWWFNDIFSAAVTLGLEKELTNSDGTKYKRETIFNDVGIGVKAANFYTIPVVEIGLSAGLGLNLPTSKYSQYRTLILGLKPNVGLSRNFEVLKGLSLRYGFAAKKSFHYATTPENDLDDVARPIGNLESPGVRNTAWSLTNSFGVNLQIVEWLGADISFALTHNYLYKQSKDIAEVEAPELGTTLPASSSFEDSQQEPPPDIRYFTSYGASLTAMPMPALAITAGFNSPTPMTDIDGKYSTPVFNRFTMVYLDISVSLSGLVSQLTSNE